jgi:acetylornithine deacetylase/succinyl-diaminopimelate desuccinylase-like protein
LLRDEKLAELASFLERIDRKRLPVHVTPAVREMVETIGDAFPFGSNPATAEFVARALPGFSPDDMMAELRTLAGELVERELLRYEPPPPLEIDMGLYGVLARVMRETDPNGVPVPYVLARAKTDARFFARLGIQTYGFLPMHLPPA